MFVKNMFVRPCSKTMFIKTMPFWSNLIQFDPIWSNLIQFDPILSNMFHIDPTGYKVETFFIIVQNKNNKNNNNNKVILRTLEVNSRGQKYNLQKEVDLIVPKESTYNFVSRKCKKHGESEIVLVIESRFLLNWLTDLNCG